MSARSWIPTVVRARQAQEDLVAQRVAVARRDAGRAAHEHAEHAARVAAMTSPRSQSVPDFHASLAVQQAAAATLAAAKNRVLFAEGRVTSETAELTVAARSRRTVEKLQERDQAEQLSTAASAAQRELDEVAISLHRALRGTS
jgi:flagellar export protein FliJ